MPPNAAASKERAREAKEREAKEAKEREEKEAKEREAKEAAALEAKEREQRLKMAAAKKAMAEARAARKREAAKEAAAREERRRKEREKAWKEEVAARKEANKEIFAARAEAAAKGVAALAGGKPPVGSPRPTSPVSASEDAYESQGRHIAPVVPALPPTPPSSDDDLDDDDSSSDEEAMYQTDVSLAKTKDLSAIQSSSKPSRPISHMTDRLKEGYMEKLGSKWPYPWNKRWFVLTSDYLYFFAGPKDRTPNSSGIIPLRGCAVGEGAPLTGKTLSFQIFHPERRTFFFACSSQSEKEAWMDIITDIIDMRSSGGSLPNVALANPAQRKSVRGSNVLKQGYLDKQGIMTSSWKRRWFVVTDSLFLQFKNFDEKDPVVSIPVKEVAVEWAGKATKRPFSFSVNHPDRPNLFYGAANRQDREDWLEALAKGGAKYTKSTAQLELEAKLEPYDVLIVPEEEDKVPDPPKKGSKTKFLQTVKIVKEGYLSLDPSLKRSFKKRYVVLTPDTLYTLSGPKATEPQLSIALETYRVGMAEALTGKRFTLHLFHMKKTNLLLVAPNEAEARTWASAIRGVVHRLAPPLPPDYE